MPRFTLTDDRVHSIDSGAAAAGPITFTVPANERWQIVAIAVKCVTTGAGAARRVSVNSLNGSTTTIVHRSAVDQGLSTTFYYNFAPGMPQSSTAAGGDQVNIPIGNHSLPAGYVLSITDNFGGAVIDAADTYQVLLSVFKQEE
jgi:hypothetical protein